MAIRLAYEGNRLMKADCVLRARLGVPRHRSEQAVLNPYESHRRHTGSESRRTVLYEDID